MKQTWNKIKNYQPRMYIVIMILSAIFFTALKVNAILLVNRVSGYIVLDVENHGEAWYVFPGDNVRYYLGLPADAFAVMRKLSIGITNKNLKKIPIGILYSGSIDSDQDGLSDNLEKAIGYDWNRVDSDNDGYNDKEEVEAGYDPLSNNKFSYDDNLIKKTAGKILLQAENNGETWYVSPQTKKRYYLGRPSDAFFIMRNLGLGITNSDLRKITANINLNTNNNSNQNTNESVLNLTPQTYNDCLSKSGETIINPSACWWLPKKRGDINNCLNVKSHWNGPEAECALIYYNPNFVFPKNIDECLAMKGMSVWEGAGEKLCSAMILENSIYNKKEAGDLRQNCPGVYSADQGCFQIFRRYLNISRLPLNYKDCENIGGSVMPTNYENKKAGGYICSMMLNKNDYPQLFQECVEKGGERSDKVAGIVGLGEGCSLNFKTIF